MSIRKSQSVSHKVPAAKKRIIFIVGPTAAGKTEVAVKVAKEINAEIISCDSMQIYRGMDTLSCMPPTKLRKEVRHHLFGFLGPGKDYNVAKYRAQALRAIKEIEKRGKQPLFVGGTGHYMSVLIDGLFKAKAQNKDVRNKLYVLAERMGSSYMHRRLKQVDSLAAGRIHPHDTRRIIRALEVYQVSGRPISELQKERKGLSDKFDIKIFSLNMDRARLYKRIDLRVDKMFKQGLVAEVSRLLKTKLSKTASSAIGIPEVRGYLNGIYDLSRAKRLIQRNSRRFAKRQLTWFRKDKRIEWIIARPRDTARVLAKKIQGKLWECSRE